MNEIRAINVSVKNLTGHIESDGLVFLNASELPVWSYLD
jgi:hypothetical protein